MSVAHKYAILQMLSIPTAEAKDPENDSHDVEPKANERAMILQDIKREIAEGGFGENEITYYRTSARNAKDIEALRHLLAEVRADRKRTRVDLDAAADQAFEDQEPERQETEQLF